MLWNPAYLGTIGTKPTVSNALPAIASPVWALDTTVLSNFYADDAGTTPATANGQTVARIANAAGGVPYLAQTTSGQRPYLVTNSIGTKPALHFQDGRNMYVAGMTNPGTLFQSRTFTIVLTYRLTNTGGSWRGLFSAGNATGGDANLGNDYVLIETGPTGWPRLFRNGGSNSSGVAPANAVYADNQLTKVVCRSAPANGMEIRVKSLSGSFVGTGPLPSSADLTTWDVAYLGSELGFNGASPPQYTMVGDIYEFRFWNARADDAQMDQLQGYSDLKWGN